MCYDMVLLIIKEIIKMNSYSQDLRDKAIEIFKTKKYTRLEISKLLKIGYTTIKLWIKEYNETGSCKIVKSSKVGRKRKFDDRDAILEILKNNPELEAKEIKKRLGLEMSMTAFYNTLSRLKITYKKKR
jgi:transposase